MIAIVCVGLRKRCLLVVGVSFLLPSMWLVQVKELRSGYFGLSLLCKEPERVLVWSLEMTVSYRLVPLPSVDHVTLDI